MKEMVILPAEVSVAKNHQQQLKVIMNLPVRLISENQVIDVLPIEESERLSLIPTKRRRLSFADSCIYPTPNQMIDFFNGCEKDDLITLNEVCAIYQVVRQTIRHWSRKGVLKRYRLDPTLTFYKKSELPSISMIYTIR